MAEDRMPNDDELASTLPKVGSGNDNEAIPPVPVRPPAEPRAFESLKDNDPSHAASNEGDGTRAS